MPDLIANGPTPAEIQQTLELFHAQRFDEAEVLLISLTEKFPDHPFAWKALGAVLNMTGRKQASVLPMQQSVRLDPSDPEAHSNLGVALYDTGELEGSEKSFRKAIQIRPEHAEYYWHLGNAVKNLGRFMDAECHYRKALRLIPEHAEALGNLGIVLYELGRLDESATSYRKAIKLKPGYAEAHNNLGNVLKDLGGLKASANAYRDAIALSPHYAAAYSNLGSVLRELERSKESEQRLRQAICLEPDLAEAHSNLLFLSSYQDEMNADEYLEMARSFGQLMTQKASKLSTYGVLDSPSDVVRVGLVSGDLRQHPVGYFLEGLCEALDTSRIELYGFPTRPHSDEVSDRLKRKFKGWLPIFTLEDEPASAIIHAQRLHILIDLSGHTAHNRLGLFAYKPAPVQATWLGYWASTGIREIDFLLGDPFVTPEFEDHHYTEKVLRLPETRFCFTPPLETVEIAPPPLLKNGYVTFGCFNNLIKMTDAVVLCWSGILNALPTAKLFLKADQLLDPAMMERVTVRFGALGVTPDRLILEGPSSRAEYLSRYNGIDIALDPFPYTGGTTTCEALWMGVPVLTKKGSRLLSRQGESIAKNAGLSEWIAEDMDDYITKAVHFASETDRLVTTKRNLRHQVSVSPLFDGVRFAQNFEGMIRMMLD